MADIIANPMNWFIAAAIVAIPLSGYIFYEIASFHYRHKKEAEIDFDFAALQRTLDEDFGTGTVVEAGTLRTL